MQLRLRRTQREAGRISKNILFCLDAIVAVTAEERANILKYQLGKLFLYNSLASQRHLEGVAHGLGSGTARGLLKAGVGLARSKLSLNITVNSLLNGHHIECKELDELLATEEAVMEVCQGLKTYLEIAFTFDGREQLIEFTEQQAIAV